MGSCAKIVVTYDAIKESEYKNLDEEMEAYANMLILDEPPLHHGNTFIIHTYLSHGSLTHVINKLIELSKSRLIQASFILPEICSHLYFVFEDEKIVYEKKISPECLDGRE